MKIGIVLYMGKDLKLIQRFFSETKQMLEVEECKKYREISYYAWAKSL